MTHNPSPALREELERRGVEPLTDIWHRAAFYEQPGNNFSPPECVDRSIRYVLRDPDNRFGYGGDNASGTLLCRVPGCGWEQFTNNPHDTARLDEIEAGHWDAAHREEFGA